MFIVEIESFTWISLYNIVTHDIVYAMIIYSNGIMHCFFFCELEFYNIIDDDEFGWDSGWLDRDVKWHRNVNIILSIIWNLKETLLKF
jgi:hypothetical protein